MLFVLLRPATEANRMNPDQLEACKEKLPPDAAREFDRLQREANDLLAERWRLRRRAWEFYHEQKRRL